MHHIAPIACASEAIESEYTATALVVETSQPWVTGFVLSSVLACLRWQSIDRFADQDSKSVHVPHHGRSLGSGQMVCAC